MTEAMITFFFRKKKKKGTLVKKKSPSPLANPANASGYA
jgi:hypothetical protein